MECWSNAFFLMLSTFLLSDLWLLISLPKCAVHLNKKGAELIALRLQ